VSAAWPGEAGGSVPLPRSYLYVPGNARDKLGRALDRGADALIVDLEDAVPTAAKEAARTEVVRWLAATDPGACQLWVRVNSGALRNADVAALAGAAHLTGLVLAKLDDPAEVDDVAGALAATGDETTLLMPLLESARAVLAAPTIAARRRVRQLQIGEVDLCADTEIEPGDDDAELAPLRAQVVLASAAAGIASPVGPVSTNVTDLPAFKASTRRVPAGLRGPLLHPPGATRRRAPGVHPDRAGDDDGGGVGCRLRRRRLRRAPGRRRADGRPRRDSSRTPASRDGRIAARDRRRCRGRSCPTRHPGQRVRGPTQSSGLHR